MNDNCNGHSECGEDDVEKKKVNANWDRRIPWFSFQQNNWQ